MHTPSTSPATAFLHDDFLLENDFSRTLYHEYVEDLPIIDYHCHLPPDEICRNKQFENLTQIWLKGDHYKWRAMRTHGIHERYITGDADDWEKFEHWAATVPYTLRNPLFHWTHLELKRYFGIDEFLKPENAREIYEACNRQLARPAFAVRSLLAKMNVEVVCTTDDPADELSFHQQFQDADEDLMLLPTFRPDPAVLIGREGFPKYIRRLGRTSETTIKEFDDLIHALQKRMAYFHGLGCRLSDHGLEHLPANGFRRDDVNRIFKQRLAGQTVTDEESRQYQSAILYHLGRMYHALDWTQQFHLGALRNTNTRALRTLGPDTGFDSIGDFSQARSLAHFLDRLDNENKLAKTILYNLNPRDNEVFATMTGNFNDGTIKGKMQYGSAWWFLDQLDGMEKQLNTLSNMGLLSSFIGMLTDSRSFLSYPRHEYFRRLLCNLFGRDVERGRLPHDPDWIGHIARDICYFNAKNYFRFS